MQKRRAHPLVRLAIAVSFVFSSLGVAAVAGQQPTVSPASMKQPTSSLRLYVFDCGVLHITDVGRFGLKPEEVTTTDLSVPCFLVVHPKGTLIWDTGAVPDTAWTPNGKEVTYHVVLPDSQERDVTMTKSLRQQLAEVGYSPADITYLALSHYHYDHTANANQFVNATWFVRQEERDAMFAPKVSSCDSALHLCGATPQQDNYYQER